ncbi:MAG: DUF3488 and transglutaminase-like domain-containing protein [Propionibacteriaceae bacterium]|nr:DUF3488 and transglutaminase-like domain-containing protein [Propionibacteriaceae bacterium]
MHALKPRPLTWPAAVDAAAVTVLLTAALAGFWPVFGGPGFIRPVVIGVVVGAGAAWLGAWRRWSTVTMAVATVVAYFVFGTAAALWNRGIAGLVPNIACVKTLVFSSVSVWRQFVTATTPVATFYPFMLVPFIVALVASVGAFTAAWRAKRPAVALIPVALLTALVILLGTSNAFYPTVQAVVLALAGICWIVWRNRQSSGTMSGRRRQSSLAGKSWLAKAGVLLGVATLVAGVAGPALYTGIDRDVLRKHVTPPLDMTTFASPLISYRNLVDTQKDTVLFTVDGWSPDYLLRLAVMDSYDGMVYNVGEATGASRYDRVGPDLGDSPAPADGKPVTVTVTDDDYSGVWVPSVSQNRDLTFSGPSANDLTASLYYNPQSDSLIDPTGLSAGASYTVQSLIPTAVPTPATPVTRVTLPSPEWVPDSVGALAVQWTGEDTSALDQVNDIVNTLRTTGYFSHGLESEDPSLPGHSSYRIDKLLANPSRMVGDDEQYAVAAALMLMKIGIPARVVMGFKADADSTLDGTTWSVKGSDAHAWVEVPFDGVGWFAFFPTPDKNQQPQQQQNKSRAKPKPQILQPPPSTTSHDDQSLQADPDSQNKNQKKDQQHAIAWRAILGYIGVGAIPVIVIVGPMVVIIALKSTRRTRRRTDERLPWRMAFAWQEILDRAADLGTVIPPSATRRQAAAIVSSVFSVSSMNGLADAADQGTFSGSPPTPAQTDAFWEEAVAAAAGLGGTRSWWRRFRAKIAVTSLRRHPRPTVTTHGGL